IRSTLASIRSARRWRCSPRPETPSAAQPGNAARAASTASSTSRSPPRATSASTCSSIGERSSKRASLGTRFPPMKWSGETATPATTGALIGQPLAYERGEGARGNREVPPPGRRGSVGETWFPPRERADGARQSYRELHRPRVNDTVAAVDRDHGAGCKRRVPGCEPRDSRSNLVWIARATKRHARRDELVGALAVGSLQLAEAVHFPVSHRGADPAGAA